MRKPVIVIFCTIAVLMFGYAGFRSYKVWNNHHLMTLAREYQRKSDLANAVLCVQKVILSNPQDLEANRMMAQLTWAARSPSALLWWTRVVELNPSALGDRVSMAQTAMMLRDYATATNALGGVSPADQNTVSYQNTAGAVAAAANLPLQAEAHFLEAARLDPQSAAVQLNLAVVRLHKTNDLDRAEARITLLRLSTNPTNSELRCQSLRELTIDALNRRESSEAVQYSHQLLQETNSAFQDKLLRLTVLQRTRDASFKQTLKTFQDQAASDPAKISELSTWQMANILPNETLSWLRSLPSTTQTNQTVEVLTANCYITLRDWQGLQTAIAPQNWAELEFMRHAFMSRALREQHLNDSAKAAWEEAFNSAIGRKAGIIMLTRLAAEWNWQTETEDLLWTIVKNYPDQTWAVQPLIGVLYQGGRTRSLMELSAMELKRVPTDLSMKNNLASTAMLLNEQGVKPFDLAREIYQQASTNAVFGSTYAFALYLQGKNTEALNIMKSYKLAELQNPAIAGYYGLILKASGDSAAARAYLERTEKVRLLPEEKKLFSNAMAGL